MIDQLIIGDKASFFDFEASVKERKITDGKKKEIKETVPFSNVTYDFSAIDGEVYWEEKVLEYVFEITAMTPEELEEKKIAFKSWVMNVMGEKLHDPFIRDYHFLATFSDIDVDDSEIEKATIKVTFKAYPYMIANTKKKYKATNSANSFFTGKEILENAVCELATYTYGDRYYHDYIVPLKCNQLVSGKTYKVVIDGSVVDYYTTDQSNAGGTYLLKAYSEADRTFTFACTGANDSKGSYLLILRHTKSMSDETDYPDTHTISIYEMRKPDAESVIFSSTIAIPRPAAGEKWETEFECNPPAITSGHLYIVRIYGVDYPCIAEQSSDCVALKHEEGITQFTLSFYEDRIAVSVSDVNFVVSCPLEIILPFEVREVVNNSSHNITPTFVSDTEFTVKTESIAYRFNVGSVKDDRIKFKPGKRTIAIAPVGKVDIELLEEVF